MSVPLNGGYRLSPPLSIGLTETLGDCDPLLLIYVGNGEWNSAIAYHRCIAGNQNKIAKMVEKLMKLSEAR